MNGIALLLIILAGIWGFVLILTRKTAMFFKIVVFSVWCYLLAVLYRVLYAHFIPKPAFHAGYLSYAGTYFFLLSAYLSMNKQEKIEIKTSMKALAVTLSTLVALWGIWNIYRGYSLLSQLLLCPVVLTAYFACRFLFCSKDSNPAIVKMRVYNAVVLGLCMMQPIMLVVMLTRQHTFIPILITSVLMVLLIPLAYRGCKE